MLYNTQHSVIVSVVPIDYCTIAYFTCILGMLIVGLHEKTNKHLRKDLMGFKAVTSDGG